ncbi:MAG TPA: host attachment protein, partial [Acidobacteriota bacterium]|nr:host attachment protein [Acidobacteriota bacterium]
APMTPRLIAVLNSTSLRLFLEDQPPGALGPQFKVVEAADFPAGRRQYTDNDSDFAGRFPRGADNNSSIDERLPMQEEYERRNVAEIARELSRFLARHPQLAWDYAAGPNLHHAVLDQLSGELRARLDRAEIKDLTKLPPQELARHFPVAAGR